MKKVLFLLLSLISPFLFMKPASAAYQGPIQLGWWYKAWGSAQVVLHANHLWAEGYDQWGNYQGRFIDFWLDWYCQINYITPGDNLGTPIRIQFAAPYGSGAGCVPAGYSQFQGWTDCLGTYSGQNFYNGWVVAEYESYVFPRSGFNSRGTTVELY